MGYLLYFNEDTLMAIEPKHSCILEGLLKPLGLLLALIIYLPTVTYKRMHPRFQV